MVGGIGKAVSWSLEHLFAACTPTGQGAVCDSFINPKPVIGERERHTLLTYIKTERKNTSIGFQLCWLNGWVKRSIIAQWSSDDFGADMK